jgi:hypothetical protein
VIDAVSTVVDVDVDPNEIAGCCLPSTVIRKLPSGTPTFALSVVVAVTVNV